MVVTSNMWPLDIEMWLVDFRQAANVNHAQHFEYLVFKNVKYLIHFYYMLQ